MSKLKSKATDFDDYLKSEFKNRKNKVLFDKYSKQLEIACQIIKLRKKRGLSQSDLAQLIGTKQSNIARMESGGQNFTVNLLSKIANTLNVSLEIKLRRIE